MKKSRPEQKSRCVVLHNDKLVIPDSVLSTLVFPCLNQTGWVHFATTNRRLYNISRLPPSAPLFLEMIALKYMDQYKHLKQGLWRNVMYKDLRFPYLPSLKTKLSGAEWRNCLEVVHGQTSLTHLDIEMGFVTQLDGAQCVRYPEVWRPLSTLLRLRSLRLRSVHIVSHENDGIASFAHLTALERLEIESNLPYEWMEHMPPSLTHLQCRDVTFAKKRPTQNNNNNNNGVSVKIVEPVRRFLHQLVTLQLSTTPSLSSHECNGWLLPCCVSLTELDIPTATRFELVLPVLRTLTLRYSVCLESVPDLEVLPHLTTLHVVLRDAKCRIRATCEDPPTFDLLQYRSYIEGRGFDLFRTYNSAVARFFDRLHPILHQHQQLYKQKWTIYYQQL